MNPQGTRQTSTGTLRSRRMPDRIRPAAATACEEYLTALARMHQVAARASPGDRWFEHRMALLQAAAGVMRKHLGIKSGACTSRLSKGILSELAAFALELPGIGSDIRATIMREILGGRVPLVTTKDPM